MEENKMLEAAVESGSKPPSTTPAYFVIVHQPQGDKKEERILVANRDASAVAQVVQSGPHESKSNIFLSADCSSGGITVTLDNNNMWNEFCRCSTEMVLTKQGRRMFPYCRYWISGMDPYQKYILAMDITPLDTHKYKWNGKWWESGGKAEPHVLGRAFIHPESPSTGQYWMHQPVSFYKLKLTNNILDQEGHIILHSMHRYLPRLHVIPADKATEVIQLNGPDVHTFTFPQTEFFAVTAYQNLQITQLKIDCNPFAKGFREGTVVGRPPKEGRPKDLAQEKDSPDSKKLEHDDQESTGKLKETFSMSEQSDAETENESVNAKQELSSLSNSQTTVLENLLLKLNQLNSMGDAHKAEAPSVPTNEPNIKIKEEPEDDYDYDKVHSTMGVHIKQEVSDDELTDVYSHSDDDYPILERHFAQFSTKLHSNRKHSVRRPSGVAKAKLLKLDDGKKPVVYLESCSTKKTAGNVSNSQERVLANKSFKEIKLEDSNDIFPTIMSFKTEEVTRTDEKRPIKRKIYADYAVPLTIRTTRGRKKKLPSTSAKSKAPVISGNDGGMAPVPKRRGRPPKNKGAKVGRPPKKKPPIETPKLFPDFKPDLEDVDGVLFVAFSSKEALDVHTKPKADVPSTPSIPPVHVELTEEQQKIVNLERQLLVQLKTMRHRQVIHPALQQVGLRLNIVDHAISIDLRYLGVELPLPFITSDSSWDNCGLSSEGLPFVSRTGKTTDYTKIKGWRDKFSTNPLAKSEAGSSETTLKNRSAFCSDELDEYLENEAKLMEDIRGNSQNETVISTVNFQFPTKSASYVRTLDSVLKRQALQASSNSLNISKSPPLPVKKRKYTRRNSTPKMEIKTKPKSPSKVAQEKPVKSHSPRKSKRQKRSEPTPPQCVKDSTTSQPVERPPLSEHEATVQPSVVSPGEDSLRSGFHHTAFESPHVTQKSSAFSKVQMKLLKLEESAVCQGKPRTYVTEERAEIALSALLTIQGFLKSKPFHKTNSKRTSPCKNEYCRLGCLCASLNHDTRKPTHCQQEACMFGCDCANSKLSLENNGLKVKSTRYGQNGEEDVNSSTKYKPGAPTHGVLPGKHTDWGTVKANKSQEVLEKPCKLVPELPGGEPNNEGIKKVRINSGDSADSCLKHWSPKVFPIWDRSVVRNNPEPLSIPEKGEVIEGKSPNHRGQSERGKVSASKSSHLYTSRSAVNMEDLNAEDWNHYTNISCARVRVYKRKATEKAKKDHDPCLDSEIPGKEKRHKPNKYRVQEKENSGDSEVAEKRHKKTDSGGPAKLLNIMSDSSPEQDPKKILNIVSQHVDNKEPQSFRVGSFNIELTSDKKDSDASRLSATSHVKISMAQDHVIDQVTAKPPPVKGVMESIKPPEPLPSETRAEKETKSHGGKGLPFYTKIIPAGKLVARLKNSTVNQSELIQVNGKNFPHAKLLLGQMGALHPANRIAAYITHRLRPNRLYLSKANEANAKTADKAGSESSAANENLKVTTVTTDVTTDGAKTTASSPQTKTVLPSTPSGVNSDFVMGEVGSIKKESPEAQSPDPSAVGLPKMHTQSSPQLLVSTQVPSSSVVTVVSSSVNMVTTTPSLPSSAVPPTINPSASIPTPLIDPNKLVTKDSSLHVTATLLNDTNNTASSGPSKSVSIPPPALTRAPCLPMTSSVPPAAYPGTNKSLAASLASSLVASANVPTIGLVSSPTGRSTVTLRTVTSPSGATQRATLTSGLDKRLGPRLLFIPVSSGTSIRPIQCVQTSPGQKMVLQPIKGPNGVNLFRHPNGQLIQLLPLQQSAKNQSQRVVIRSQGPGVSIQQPLKTKTDAGASTLVTTDLSSVPPAPALQTLSLSRISPVKSGVTVIPTSPSQLATLRIGTLPRVGSDVSPSPPKVVAYANGGCGIITSAGVPLQSGGLPVLKCSSTTALNSSQKDYATKPNVIVMTGKPAVVIDSNNLANLSFLKSSKTVSSKQNIDRENSKECKGLSSLGTVKTTIIVEKESEPKESNTSAEQVVFTSSIEKIGEVEKSAVPSQIMVTIHESEKSDIVTKDFSSSTNKKAGTPSQTITVNPTAEKELYPKNPVVKRAQDPDNPAPESCRDPKNLEANTSQDSTNAVAESDQASENLTTESYQDQKNPLAKDDCISLDQTSEQTVEPAYDTVQVHPVSDSETNQQNLCKSEQKGGEKCREGDLVTDTTMYMQDENLPSDTGYNSSTQEGENNSQSEDESDADEYVDIVDIETVEEASGKIRIAYLKATTHPTKSYDDQTAAFLKALAGRKMDSKVNENVSSPKVEDCDTPSHRRNHTANERKRRNEMRDLFEELKNALGLHNLPKVSKSYILKKAIEEIEGLTDEADSLIKQKTLISQKHSELIKKVSNLSGKPKEVVLKKLEYLCAKQKALEVESKKIDFEEDVAPKASVNKPPLPFPPLSLQEEPSSSQTRKPIILSKKHVPLTEETPQPTVITRAQMEPVKEAIVGEAAGIAPTLEQADVRPEQMSTGMASVVIQLPGPIELKDFISNSSVPITLSAVPHTVSAEEPSSVKSEQDDLSMMPKIVNVTSLAGGASADLVQELGLYTTLTSKAGTDTEVHTPLAEVSDQAGRHLPSIEDLPTTFHPVHTTDIKHSSSDSSLPENLPLSNISVVNMEASKKVTANDSCLQNVSEVVRDSELELALKRLSSAIDEAELDPSELSDIMADHDDSDETLTSLLNEIALLNQHLNNDPSDTHSDFPESITPSQGGIGKSADGNSSPFLLGRLKELSEPKEKNISLSPLFLQLDEGEIQESVKHSEEPGIVVFEGATRKGALTKVENHLLQPPANMAFLQANDKPGVASTSEVFWRPMPKLAPLGLKASNLPSDQRLLGNKSMPSLASAAVRLSDKNVLD